MHALKLNYPNAFYTPRLYKPLKSTWMVNNLKYMSVVEFT